MPHRNEATEPQQELLEALWQHEEEGRPLDPARVGEALVDELVGAGWLDGPTQRLTALGKDLARRAIRRHRLAERLLTDVLGSQGDAGHEDACRLEHSLMEGLAEKVCTFLGHPKLCPHGHAIPEGPCCSEACSETLSAVSPLTQLSPGEEGRVAYLATAADEDLQKFLSMGVHPGDRLTLLRKSPTVVFRCGHSQFAVDRELAAQVYVRRL
jgi:DtxR family Mn-dependent transcriptional regulator